MKNYRVTTNDHGVNFITAYTMHDALIRWSRVAITAMQDENTVSIKIEEVKWPTYH